MCVVPVGLVRSFWRQDHLDLASCLAWPQGLREVCTADGALLCFDEVMTGFRIAKGCAQAHFGIMPDLTTVRYPLPVLALPCMHATRQQSAYFPAPSCMRGTRQHHLYGAVLGPA